MENSCRWIFFFSFLKNEKDQSQWKSWQMADTASRGPLCVSVKGRPAGQPTHKDDPPFKQSFSILYLKKCISWPSQCIIFLYRCCQIKIPALYHHSPSLYSNYIQVTSHWTANTVHAVRVVKLNLISCCGKVPWLSWLKRLPSKQEITSSNLVGTFLLRIPISTVFLQKRSNKNRSSVGCVTPGS